MMKDEKGLKEQPPKQLVRYSSEMGGELRRMSRRIEDSEK